MVKRFFNEKEVTSTLVMDALFSGCKQLEEASRLGDPKKVRLRGVGGLAACCAPRLQPLHARLPACKKTLAPPCVLPRLEESSEPGSQGVCRLCPGKL